MCTWRSLCLLTAALMMGGALSAQEFVYVESNAGQTLQQNSVYAYSVSSRGALRAVSGSPYLTQGSGVFSPNPLLAPGFLSDQQIVANAAGTLLFAVNGHSDTVSSFAINSDGSLNFLARSPSNGPDPVSLGLDELSSAGTQLTVLNQGLDPAQGGNIPNITSFLVDTAGNLTQVAGGTVHFLRGSSPFQALPSPSGRFLFLQEAPGANSILNSYSIGAGGKFVLNNSLAPTGGSQFGGIAANPKQRVVYVAVKDTNLIEVLTYNTQGLMAYADTVTDPGQGVTWLTTNAAGTRLFASEIGSNTVTSYNIGGGNVLSPVQISTVTLKAGGSPAQLRVNAAGNLLFVLGLDETGTAGSFLHVLSVDSFGVMAEVGPPLQIPVRAGEVPQGIAVIH